MRLNLKPAVQEVIGKGYEKWNDGLLKQRKEKRERIVRSAPVEPLHSGLMYGSKRYWKGAVISYRDELKDGYKTSFDDIKDCVNGWISENAYGWIKEGS